jgi:hypothetical protein
MKRHHKTLLFGIVIGIVLVYVYEKYKASKGQSPSRPLG